MSEQIQENEEKISEYAKKEGDYRRATCQNRSVVSRTNKR